MSPKTAVLAIRKLFKQTGLSIDEIDSLEVNEAFAVIDVLLEREFPGIRDRLNPLGGALAYGHPYGASGAIILLHLLKNLQVNKGRFGSRGDRNLPFGRKSKGIESKDIESTLSMLEIQNLWER